MIWRRGQAYGQDLRDRVFLLFDEGYGVVEIAEMLCVSVSYVSKVLNRHRRTGERSARPQICHVLRKLQDFHEEIRKKIAECPDMTLSEILEWLQNDHDMKVSIATLHAELCRLDLTWKKKSLHAEEQKRDDVAEKRENWRNNQGNPDPEKLVFIDETAITTDMTRTHGRSPRGEPLLGYKPNGHRNTTTFIGALRQEGMTAPFLVDGPHA